VEAAGASSIQELTGRSSSDWAARSLEG